VLLRLDHNHPFLCDVMVAYAKQPVLAEIRKGRPPDVKTDVYGRSNLVDILTACALGTDRTHLDLFGGNHDLTGDSQSIIRHLLFLFFIV